MSASAKRSYRPETQLVHAGILRSQFGETSEALFLTQGYVYDSSASAERRFKNEEPGYQYSRFSNPTVTMFEQRMAALEGAEVTDEAILEAGRARLRPILMTSFAFILGVVPLVTATGAGANSRKSIGIAVFSGMLASTCLAVLFVPSFFVVVRRFEEWRAARKAKPAAKAAPAE